MSLKSMKTMKTFSNQNKLVRNTPTLGTREQMNETKVVEKLRHRERDGCLINGTQKILAFLRIYVSNRIK